MTPRSVLTVDFGEPFDLAVEETASGRERLRTATEQLRDTLAAHVARARVDNGGQTTAAQTDPAAPAPADAATQGAALRPLIRGQRD